MSNGPQRDPKGTPKSSLVAESVIYSEAKGFEPARSHFGLPPISHETKSVTREPPELLTGVSESAAAIYAYLKRNPHRAEETPSWIAIAIWAEDYYPAKPSEYDVTAALGELITARGRSRRKGVTRSHRAASRGPNSSGQSHYQRTTKRLSVSEPQTQRICFVRPL
jgi:hypothetical protein